MIKRYENIEIKKLWDKESQLEIWKKIEFLHYEELTKVLFIDNKKNIFNSIKVNKERFFELENKTKHEMAAFVQMISEQFGPEGRWIHFGLTSNDILDTSQNFLIKESLKILVKKLEKLLELLEKRAKKNKNIIMIGRTHGMWAEPITVGLKFAWWFYEIKFHLSQVKEAIKIINFVKMGGPTGLNAHFSTKVIENVALNLDMKVNFVGTQLFPRDRLIFVTNTLSNLVTTFEKIAIEIRNLHRSEISEFKESFNINQKGSSAMPHKQNPYLSENVCGLSRLFRGIASSIYSTNLVWHERDLTNSSIERIAIPDLFHLITTTTDRLTNICENLFINYEIIKKNLKKATSKILSHRLLLFLIKETKKERNECYRLIQNIYKNFENSSEDFKLFLKKQEFFKTLSKEEFEKLFKFEYYIKNINKIFNQIFLK